MEQPSAVHGQIKEALHVFEHDEVNLKIRKKYYFELLPFDIKQLLRYFINDSTIFVDDEPSASWKWKYHIRFFLRPDIDTVALLSSVNTSAQLAGYFYFAFRRPKNDLMQLFLEFGGDPNMKPKGCSYTLLNLAVKFGDVSPVRLLLDAGAKVFDECNDFRHILCVDQNSPDNEPGCNSLYLSIKSKNKPVAKALLEKGADPYEFVCHKTVWRHASDHELSLVFSAPLLRICREKWGDLPEYKDTLELVEQYTKKI